MSASSTSVRDGGVSSAHPAIQIMRPITMAAMHIHTHQVSLLDWDMLCSRLSGECSITLLSSCVIPPIADESGLIAHPHDRQPTVRAISTSLWLRVSDRGWSDARGEQRRAVPLRHLVDDVL